MKLTDYEYSILDEGRRDEINECLKLRELVEEEIKYFEKQRKQAFYPSKKRGMLYKKIKWRQSLLDQSKGIKV